MKRLALNTEIFFSTLDRILSTLQINEILTSVVDDIRATLGADRCTLYLIDNETQELYTKVLQSQELIEIRLPLTKTSLAGYTAVTGKTLNIRDAYNSEEILAIDPELSFDRRWDEASGYRTSSVLVVPVPIQRQNKVVGVFQALNKAGGFSAQDVVSAEQLAYLLGIAVTNALLYQAVEDERRLREYIIDDIEDGICIINAKEEIVSANRFIEVMSGLRYSVEEMKGKNLFDVFPQFSDSVFVEKLRDVFEYGYRTEALLEMVAVKLIPYLDENGRLRKVILIFSRIR
jgi:PAS domain S-box-containing protein